MEIKDRLKELRKSLNLSQDEFGTRLGVARNTIANYEIGLRTPREATIVSICREFGVNRIWLTQGIGEMFEESDDTALDLIDQVMAGESDFAKALFKTFAKFDRRDWEDLERLIDKLIETKKEADQ
ncbi:helix-turn-helix transcriptional regulator [Fournierella sp.]|uniref:helix-turn-helix domain-containing protein n=1 Tax=Allofournierella sp. TaxID=1940256 RepID=UPI0025BA7502|nr:helix-turn-helix transcriptional regulator [Fournierella sp.]